MIVQDAFRFCSWAVPGFSGVMVPDKTTRKFASDMLRRLYDAHPSDTPCEKRQRAFVKEVKSAWERMAPLRAGSWLVQSFAFLQRCWVWMVYSEAWQFQLDYEPCVRVVKAIGEAARGLLEFHAAVFRKQTAPILRVAEDILERSFPGISARLPNDFAKRQSVLMMCFWSMDDLEPDWSLLSPALKASDFALPVPRLDDMRTRYFAWILHALKNV